MKNRKVKNRKEEGEGKEAHLALFARVSWNSYDQRWPRGPMVRATECENEPEPVPAAAGCSEGRVGAAVGRWIGGRGGGSSGDRGARVHHSDASGSRVRTAGAMANKRGARNKECGERGRVSMGVHRHQHYGGTQA